MCVVYQLLFSSLQRSYYAELKTGKRGISSMRLRNRPLLGLRDIFYVEAYHSRNFWLNWRTSTVQQTSKVASESVWFGLVDGWFVISLNIWQFCIETTLKATDSEPSPPTQPLAPQLPTKVHSITHETTEFAFACLGQCLKLKGKAAFVPCRFANRTFAFDCCHLVFIR